MTLADRVSHGRLRGSLEQSHAAKAPKARAVVIGIAMRRILASMASGVSRLLRVRLQA